jgi:phage tail-like protein
MMITRPDPYRAFRFRVEVAGLQVGGFQSVSGLARESKIEPFREGGVNHYEHQLVTLTTYPPLVLKRGLFDTLLWDWHKDVIEGRVQRRTITIKLLNDAGHEVWHWICEKAFPSKWTGAELDATGNAIATESIEFVHHGLTRQ